MMFVLKFHTACHWFDFDLLSVAQHTRKVGDSHGGSCDTGRGGGVGGQHVTSKVDCFCKSKQGSYRRYLLCRHCSYGDICILLHTGLFIL